MLKKSKITAIIMSTVFLFSLTYASTKIVKADYSTKVDPSIQYQTVDGWGTSLCWWANVLGGAPDSVRNNYADLMFNPTTGLGLNVLRYNIGGGENPNYNYLQPRAKVPGFEPSSGVYDWTADANQRWMLQAAISRGANKYEAFSNSPPYWMTVSGSVTGASGGGNNLNSSYYDGFSDYLTTVVKHFKDSWGVTFNTLEPFNEPVSSWWKLGSTQGTSQEGCHIDNSIQDTIIQKVGASLSSKGLTTKVSTPDDNSIDESLNSVNSYTSAAFPFISQFNTHSYNGSKRSDLLVAAKGKNKGLWMSEYGDGDATGLTMANKILADMKTMQATAWVYWQVVDNAAGWGMLKSPLDGSTDYSYTTNEKYYVMGNFSKFIRPGYKIISVNDANSLAAYDITSGKVVIVTVNSTTSDTSITYDLSKFGGISSATPYRTSATENLAQLSSIAISSGTFIGVAKANSVTTFVISGATYSGSTTGLDTATKYAIVNENSGLPLDVPALSKTAGVQLDQYAYNGGANQKWTLVSTGTNQYKIVNVNSGLDMDISGSSTVAGAAVIQNTDTGVNSQKWTIVSVGNGDYSIKNVNSSLALDISGGSLINGGLAIQWGSNNGSNQKWKLVPIN